MQALNKQHCTVCELGGKPLAKKRIKDLLSHVPEWQVNHEHTTIERIFAFKTFAKTIAFANAVAWIAHSEAHHPEWLISYNQCKISYTTHAVNGLTENDFICAAKVNKLY